LTGEKRIIQKKKGAEGNTEGTAAWQPHAVIENGHGDVQSREKGEKVRTSLTPGIQRTGEKGSGDREGGATCHLALKKERFAQHDLETSRMRWGIRGKEDMP